MASVVKMIGPTKGRRRRMLLLMDHDASRSYAEAVAIKINKSAATNTMAPRVPLAFTDSECIKLRVGLVRVQHMRPRNPHGDDFDIRRTTRGDNSVGSYRYPVRLGLSTCRLRARCTVPFKRILPENRLTQEKSTFMR
jgi:hypothetical protein